MICKQCGWWKRICHCRELELFNTSKDKLWEFTDYNTTGKPVEIRSKGQWNRHLKKLGLNDDIKQTRNRDEIANSFHKKSEFKPVDRRELTKTILQAYQETRRK